MKPVYSCFARTLFLIHFVFLSAFSVLALGKDDPPLADHFFVVLKDSDTFCCFKRTDVLGLRGTP